MTAFNPPTLLRNPHLQSMLPDLLAIGKKAKLQTSIHEAETGKPFVLAERTAQTDSDSPVFVLIPGIEGSHRSSVIRLLLTAEHLAQSPMLVLSHRGINLTGEQITPYHGGLTTDLAYTIQLLRERFPHRPIHAVGFSLGANILLNYASDNHTLDHITAISTPFDLRACSDRIPAFYQRIILKRMRQRTENCNTLYKQLNWNEITRIREVDEKLIAPHFGYQSANHYYAENSSKDRLNKITCSTTLISAHDDPFIHPDSWPDRSKLPKHIRMITPKYGGHMAFHDCNAWLAKLLYNLNPLHTRQS